MQVFTFNPQTRIIEFRGTVSHYSEQTVTTCTPKRPIYKKRKDHRQRKAWVIRGSYSLSSSNSMTFHDFFHDLLQFSSTIVASFSCHFHKVSKLHVSFSKGRFWNNSVQQARTNPGLQHKNCVAFAPFNIYYYLSFDINSD